MQELLNEFSCPGENGGVCLGIDAELVAEMAEANGSFGGSVTLNSQHQ
jgi:hypothetical protein